LIYDLRNIPIPNTLVLAGILSHKLANRVAPGIICTPDRILVGQLLRLCLDDLPTKRIYRLAEFLNKQRIFARELYALSIGEGATAYHPSKHDDIIFWQCNRLHRLRNMLRSLYVISNRKLIKS